MRVVVCGVFKPYVSDQVYRDFSRAIDPSILFWFTGGYSMPGTEMGKGESTVLRRPTYCYVIPMV